mmetsp:Transcript_34180/g.63365  ORF Transcript_34180/g.63365 Transcript_34180/m.63365 type:complete len:196 (-) Transcript_34180:635-1222(-)
MRNQLCANLDNIVTATDASDSQQTQRAKAFSVTLTNRLKLTRPETLAKPSVLRAKNVSLKKNEPRWKGFIQEENLTLQFQHLSMNRKEKQKAHVSMTGLSGLPYTAEEPDGKAPFEFHFDFDSEGDAFSRRSSTQSAHSVNWNSLLADDEYEEAVVLEEEKNEGNEDEGDVDGDNKMDICRVVVSLMYVLIYILE